MKDASFMFEDFLHHASYVRPSDIVCWYAVGPREILVRLKDGSKVYYDYLTKYTRRVRYNKFHTDGEPDLSEEEWRAEFGRRLRKRVEEQHITQKELSERTDISEAMLAKYRNGKSTPSTYVITKLARALECTTAELINFW